MTTTPRTSGETQVLTSVANAARVLREFGKGDAQLGVSDLARRLGSRRAPHTASCTR